MSSAVAIVLSVGALAVSSCSGGSSPGSLTSSTTAVPTSTTEDPTAATVLDAWRHYWDVYLAVGGEMQLPDSRLAEVATGEELRTLGGAFLADASQGIVYRGSIDLAPRVVAIEGEQATLSDCYLSRIVGAHRESGNPVGPPATQRTQVTASLLREQGTWKVAGIRHDGEGCTPAS